SNPCVRLDRCAERLRAPAKLASDHSRPPCSVLATSPQPRPCCTCFPPTCQDIRPVWTALFCTAVLWNCGLRLRSPQVRAKSLLTAQRAESGSNQRRQRSPRTAAGSGSQTKPPNRRGKQRYPTLLESQECSSIAEKERRI